MAADNKNSETGWLRGCFGMPGKMLCAELETIRKRRRPLSAEPSSEKIPPKSTDRQVKTRDDIENKLVGLALSGGGIRSAVFSLGVMQRLAKAGYLERVDYLSTVSGGGFIGGSLTWLLSDQAAALRSDGQNDGFQPFGTERTTFPYGVKRRLSARGETQSDCKKCKEVRKESNILKHLRLHGNYLTPGKGITWTSLVAVFLRGIMLNFVVWFPLLVLLMVGLTTKMGAIRDWLSSELHTVFNTTASTWILYECAELIACFLVSDSSGLSLLLFPTAVAGVVFLLMIVFYSLRTMKGHPYLHRRCFEKKIRMVLWIGLAFLAIGIVPIMDKALHSYGISSVFFGIIGGVYSYLISRRDGIAKIPLNALAALACILIFYGLALASYKLALYCICCFEVNLLPWWGWVLVLSAVVIWILTAFRVNLNYITFHRYYRDRIMEAFMPHPDTCGTTAAAQDADAANLSDMCSDRAPYHLVNTNVILVDSDCSTWRKRGGDSFILSPKFCGSTATGWVKTEEYMREDPLSLPTAVAISGAAANPNTAAGGTGATRKPMMSLLMRMLNISLGYWVPNPGKSSRRRMVAHHFRAAYHELCSRGYAEHQKLLQISDGGHFENLGVYELIRRKVKLIICCDGTADPDFKFTALQVLARRIRTDFGTQLIFENENKEAANKLELLIPRDPDPEKVLARDLTTDAYPVGMKFAKQGHIKGRIIYNDETEGTLILLKTTMIKRLGLLLKGYKGANPDFPDQSTTDQFFDEEQFDAYRELGYEIADRMVNDKEEVDIEDELNKCI